jgi:hypothetical protein
VQQSPHAAAAKDNDGDDDGGDDDGGGADRTWPVAAAHAAIERYAKVKLKQLSEQEIERRRRRRQRRGLRTKKGYLILGSNCPPNDTFAKLGIALSPSFLPQRRRILFI